MLSFIATSLFILSTAQAVVFRDNVPADVRDQMLQDLEFMYSVQGEKESELHKEVFGNVSGSDYKKFFESRVAVVGLYGCGNPNAVACVLPSVSTTNKTDHMFITTNYIKFSHPQISRLMVVYHEARHTEDEHLNWMHAHCPTPFLDENGKPKTSIWTQAQLQGEPACDKTPIGSYGASVILLKNIQNNCTNCNEKVKMDAGLYGDDQLERIIDAKAKKSLRSDLY